MRMGSMSILDIEVEKFTLEFAEIFRVIGV